MADEAGDVASAHLPRTDPAAGRHAAAWDPEGWGDVPAWGGAEAGVGAVPDAVPGVGVRPRRRRVRVAVAAASLGVLVVIGLFSAGPDAIATWRSPAASFDDGALVATTSAGVDVTVTTTAPVATSQPVVAPHSSTAPPRSQPTSAGAPAPTSPAIVPRLGEIVGVAGLCVDLDGGVAVNGGRIKIWDCNGTEAQFWFARSDGTLQVKGVCLRIENNATAAGTVVEAWSCDAAAASQQWRFVSGRIVNPATGLCLDSPDGVSGTQLRVAVCGSNPGQQWTPPPPA